MGTNLEQYKFYRRMDTTVETLTDDTLLARLADPRTTAEACDNARFDSAEAVALYRRESTAAPELWFAIMSDRRFRVPSTRVAESHAAHTPATFAYLFTWKSPGWDGQRGASHEVNTPFVFGTYDTTEARGVAMPTYAGAARLGAFRCHPPNDHAARYNGLSRLERAVRSGTALLGQRGAQTRI